MDIIHIFIIIGGIVIALIFGLQLKSPDNANTRRVLIMLYFIPPVGLVAHALISFRTQPVISSMFLVGCAIVILAFLLR